MKTSLKQHEVWYDGMVTCRNQDIEQYINKVPDGMLAVDELTDNIRQFNKMVSKQDAIKVKTVCNPLDYSWNVPDKYTALDMKTYLLGKLAEMDDLSEDELQLRLSRTLMELQVFKKAGLIEMLQCLIYVVDTFMERGVVWGVGRGSSVSSYVLFLIGIHDIDCVLFDLPFTDFMKRD